MFAAWPLRALVDNAAVRSLCPQRHEHSPPPARVPSTAHSPLLPLPSVTLLRLAITFAQLDERVPSGIFDFYFLFFWALQHSAVCFNVFLPSELWENKEKAFFGSVLGHIKATACPPQRLGSAGAMSSPLSHSKDQPRIRKTTTDSSPTSLTARSLRVRLIEPVLACLLQGVWR